MNPARFAINSITLTLLLATQPLARAGDGDGPDLTPPAEMPNAPKPAVPPAPAPTPNRPLVSSPGGRAVLAVPNITPPLARPSNTTQVQRPSLEPIPDELSIDAPREMKPAPSPARPRTTMNPDRSTRPLVLESSPMGEPSPLDGPIPKTTNPPKRSTTITPQQAPVRRARFFGLLPGPAPAPPIAPGRATTADNLREDPAPDSALKRRIEKQARDAIGNRAGSIEVKVVGKNATVQAHGVKMLQKRNVRKSLESLPALAGLRTTIEVND